MFYAMSKALLRNGLTDHIWKSFLSSESAWLAVPAYLHSALLDLSLDANRPGYVLAYLYSTEEYSDQNTRPINPGSRIWAQYNQYEASRSPPAAVRDINRVKGASFAIGLNVYCAG